MHEHVVLETTDHSNVLYIPPGIVLSKSYNHIQGVDLDEDSSRELSWLLDHFIVFEHWKILESEREFAIALRDKLETGKQLSHQEAKDANAIINKVFDISDEIPRANFRWKEENFLEVAGVLEEISNFSR
jgi:hypothetical protein